MLSKLSGLAGFIAHFLHIPTPETLRLADDGDARFGTEQAQFFSASEDRASKLGVAMSARRKQKQAAAPIGDRLLTLREAADVLRLSMRTVREYVTRGEIEGRIIGNRWRFRRADRDAFFANALPLPGGG